MAVASLHLVLPHEGPAWLERHGATMSFLSLFNGCQSLCLQILSELITDFCWRSCSGIPQVRHITSARFQLHIADICSQGKSASAPSPPPTTAVHTESSLFTTSRIMVCSLSLAKLRLYHGPTLFHRYLHECQAMAARD